MRYGNPRALAAFQLDKVEAPNPCYVVVLPTRTDPRQWSARRAAAIECGGGGALVPYPVPATNRVFEGQAWYLLDS